MLLHVSSTARFLCILITIMFSDQKKKKKSQNSLRSQAETKYYFHTATLLSTDFGQSPSYNLVSPPPGRLVGWLVSWLKKTPSKIPFETILKNPLSSKQS